MKQKIVNGVLVCMLEDEDDTLILKAIRGFIKVAIFTFSLISFNLPLFSKEENIDE